MIECRVREESMKTCEFQRRDTLDGLQAVHAANGGESELKTAFFSEAIFREMNSYAFRGHHTRDPFPKPGSTAMDSTHSRGEILLLSGQALNFTGEPLSSRRLVSEAFFFRADHVWMRSKAWVAK